MNLLWNFRHWWYNHLSGPIGYRLHDMQEEIAIHGVRQLVAELCDHGWYKHVTSHWLRSPLGSFIRKSRGYDTVVRHCQEYVCDIRELRDQLRAHEAQDNAEIWDLREQLDMARQSRMKWQMQSGRNRILADQAKGLIQENEVLRKQVQSWLSFYDWMCDDGRLQEHEIEPSM